MNLNRSTRGFAALLVFAATVAAFVLPANAADTSAAPLFAQDTTPTITEADLDAAFQRGLLTALMDIDTAFSLPNGAHRYSFLTMADIASMSAQMMRLMGAPLGAAYFDGRAQVFAAAAAYYGEDRNG